MGPVVPRTRASTARAPVRKPRSHKRGMAKKGWFTWPMGVIGCGLRAPGGLWTRDTGSFSCEPLPGQFGLPHSTVATVYEWVSILRSRTVPGPRPGWKHSITSAIFYWSSGYTKAQIQRVGRHRIHLWMGEVSKKYRTMYKNYHNSMSDNTIGDLIAESFHWEWIHKLRKTKLRNSPQKKKRKQERYMR